MNIRNATEKDLAPILDIFNYEVLHEQFVYIYEPWTLDSIKEWFREKQQNGFPLIVLEEENKIHGYGTYDSFRAREAYNTSVEYSVYIHRNHRKKGYARKLVQHLIEIAKEQGRHCFIGGLDSENKASYDFHKRMGFTEVAHIKQVARKFDKWLDLIFFQLILDNEC